MEDLEKKPAPENPVDSLEMLPKPVYYSGIPSHLAQHIPPSPRMVGDEDGLEVSEAEISREPSRENASGEIGIANPAKDHSSDDHLPKSRQSKFMESVQIKWIEFAFSNPTPFRIKLTEMLVPDMKQTCKAILALDAAIKSHEKVIAEIKKVIRGENA